MGRVGVANSNLRRRYRAHVVGVDALDLEYEAFDVAVGVELDAAQAVEMGGGEGFSVFDCHAERVVRTVAEELVAALVTKVCDVGVHLGLLGQRQDGINSEIYLLRQEVRCVSIVRPRQSGRNRGGVGDRVINEGAEMVVGPLLENCLDIASPVVWARGNICRDGNSGGARDFVRQLSEIWSCADGNGGDLVGEDERVGIRVGRDLLENISELSESMALVEHELLDSRLVRVLLGSHDDERKQEEVEVEVAVAKVETAGADGC